ncbi:MAG: hypothetical protein JO168_11345 [Solirubrobacterales bacterium]|nr:hypothetical protein [Solirubrobacterales bacterium]
MAKVPLWPSGGTHGGSDRAPAKQVNSIQASFILDAADELPVTTTALRLEMTSAAPYDPTTGSLAISELHIPGVT